MKVCGLTQREDVKLAVSLGANFLGFILVEQSPRHVDIPRARQLTRGLPPSVDTVAVCIDPGDGFLKELIAQVQPDRVQLHGEESPERCAEIRERFDCPVIKAVCPEEIAGSSRLAEYLNVPDLMLLADRISETRRGGSGNVCYWPAAAELARQTEYLFLAGGLTPGNVVEAITAVHPFAVDVNSGLEDAPGSKSPELLKRLFHEVKYAVVR